MEKDKYIGQIFVDIDKETGRISHFKVLDGPYQGKYWSGGYYYNCFSIAKELPIPKYCQPNSQCSIFKIKQCIPYGPGFEVLFGNK